jgi:hypothetical protein
MVLNTDSSPFQSSPFNASEGNSSPRLFWQGRDPATPNRFNSENGLFGHRDPSPSPQRRSSIEKLQRASRVKNSNMFAREQKQEYDPASVPVVERPLAKQIQGNAYGGMGIDGLRSEERGRFGHSRTDSKSNVLYTPTKTPLSPSANVLPHTGSPSKDNISPMKSSMSTSRFNPKASYNPEHGTWSEENSGDERQLPEGRSLHRHAKSVTFDAAPPQVNEYEMATPDLSSVGTNSRENSYDSGEEDEEQDSYHRGESDEPDDSFDASLEDTDKTPVVGPDDWRHGSPTVRGSGGAFAGYEGSPMPDAEPSSLSSGNQAGLRNNGGNSSGDHRPLPPLPGVMAESCNSNGLAAAAERARNSQRSLPSTPAAASFSKSDIQGLNGGRMPLEERLRLMMIQDDDKPKSAAELQRERRMRRGGARDRNSQTPEAENGHINIHEDEDTLGDLGDYQLPPRISRESILRKVNGQESFGLESDYNFSSPMPSSSPERPAALDPDVPIPSTEDISILEDDSVIIKPEDDDDVDVYDIPEMYQPRAESRQEDYNMNDSIIRELRDEDNDSEYSDPTPLNQSSQGESQRALTEDGPPTPRQNSPRNELAAATIGGDGKRVSLPEFSGFLASNDFGLDLQSYITPSPPPVPAKDGSTTQALFTQSLCAPQRPFTPPNVSSLSKSLSRPEYDGTGWGSEDEEEPGTPESVLHHPPPLEPSPPRDSPAIPEQVATIKSSSGSKLKTRPSATPSDLMAMREARRIVSSEVANIPPIPERHRNRPSLNIDRNEEEFEDGNDEEGSLGRKPSLKKKSLTLDIGSDLGLGLDKDFDRVIEAQKVAFDLISCPPTSVNNGVGQVSSLGAKNPGCCDHFANITPRKQRGYLMRQNTKLVVASSDVDKADEFRGTRSAGNSPVKQTRPQSWTVEPWNGQMRKKSVRDSMNPRKKPASGPAPPLPGQASNVSGMGTLAEEESQADLVDTENGERGRVFVKVIGVKDLDLPLPKSKHFFSSHLKLQ